MKRDIRSDVFSHLFIVPTLWAHKHYNDENEQTFDKDMIEFCETCKERFELALETGRLCKMHPMAYFEPATKTRPAFCEECWLQANREVRS